MGNDKRKEYATLICLCGETTKVRMSGNNNADGKAKCGCGRNITVHLRRHKKKVIKWCDKTDCSICNPKPLVDFSSMGKGKIVSIKINCPKCKHKWLNQRYGGTCPTCGCDNKGKR